MIFLLNVSSIKKFIGFVVDIMYDTLLYDFTAFCSHKNSEILRIFVKKEIVMQSGNFVKILLPIKTKILRKYPFQKLFQKLDMFLSNFPINMYFKIYLDWHAQLPH